MKLTSKQFQVKADYYKDHPYLSYIVSKGYDVYECSVVYFDNRKTHMFLSNLCLPDSSGVTSVLIRKLDFRSIDKELQFFKTFLMSCNLVQLRHFCVKVFDLYHDLNDICVPFLHDLKYFVDPGIYSDLLSQLSSFAGDRFACFYNDRYGKN